jgi:RNA polymerase sigma factor (sigma-70 family)
MTWNPLSRRKEPSAAPGATAFEAVILPHLDAAYNLARWLVGDPILAEDVVQDATVRALRYFGSYRGGNARSWLLQIVRNTAHEARATRQRHAATSLDDEPDHEGVATALQVADPSDDPEAVLGRCEDQRMLTDALERLPIELRECLVLRELEELSYKEIAHVTDVPVGTVMSRLWRARQALKPALAQGASR